MQKKGLKTNSHCRSKNITMENNELKKVSIKNRACYYFDDIIRF